MPEFHVLNQGNLPTIATISGDNAKDAIANADPALDLPSRVTLVKLVGDFVVVPAAEDGTEVVQRVTPPAPEPDPVPDVPAPS